MKQILKEPLLHFLLIGAALFVVFGLTSKPAATAENEILISEGLVDHLTTMFSRTWQRPPTEEELAGLLRDHIREEIAYREATALGLDRDDSIIRRRLRQKLEFLADETTSLREPTDDELRTLLLESPEKYAVEPEFSFVQVYLNPDRHKEDVNGHAKSLLEQLRTENLSGNASLEMSDATMLPPRMEAAPMWMIRRTFGSPFADALTGQPVGEWTGPVVSGFGLHLVLIEEMTPGRTPELDEARDAVLRDWQSEHKKKSLDTLYEQMTSRYEIVIEDEDVAELLENGK